MFQLYPRSLDIIVNGLCILNCYGKNWIWHRILTVLSEIEDKSLFEIYGLTDITCKIILHCTGLFSPTLFYEGLLPICSTFVLLFRIPSKITKLFKKSWWRVRFHLLDWPTISMPKESDDLEFDNICKKEHCLQKILGIVERRHIFGDMNLQGYSKLFPTCCPSGKW